MHLAELGSAQSIRFAVADVYKAKQHRGGLLEVNMDAAGPSNSTWKVWRDYRCGVAQPLRGSRPAPLTHAWQRA